jgi:hypothetical protein
MSGEIRRNLISTEQLNHFLQWIILNNPFKNVKDEKKQNLAQNVSKI